MSLPSKVINVRLTPEQTQRFQRLKREFSGLPQATVLRLLLSSYLDLPLEKQVEVVTEQIRGAAKQRPDDAERQRMIAGTNRARH